MSLGCYTLYTFTVISFSPIREIIACPKTHTRTHTTYSRGRQLTNPIRNILLTVSSLFQIFVVVVVAIWLVVSSQFGPCSGKNRTSGSAFVCECVSFYLSALLRRSVCVQSCERVIKTAEQIIFRQEGSRKSTLNAYDVL